MVTIKTYTEPTDIVIVGCNFNDYSCTFEITDDEQSIMVSTDEIIWSREKALAGLIKNMETTGLVSILTKEEFIAKISMMWRCDKESEIIEGIILNGFVGDIKLAVTDENNVDQLSSFDENEGLMYQPCFPEDMDIEDMFIVLPEGTKLEVFNIADIIKKVK